jgi:uncharacterized protein YacL
LKLSLVVILSGVIGLVIGGVRSVLDLAGAPIVADIVSNVVSSVLFIFLYGIMAAAYVQVQYDDQDGFDGSESSQPMGGAVASDP